LTDIAIKVEGRSKLYKIGKLQRRHDTLRDRIADLFKRSDVRNQRSDANGNEGELRISNFELRNDEPGDPQSDSDSSNPQSAIRNSQSEICSARFSL
jgi:hypothetical protein